MTSQERKQYYIELLILGYGLLIVSFLFTLDYNRYNKQCDVIHENAPRPELRCEVYDEKR